MTNSSKQGFASSFDDMLSRNRKQFESLFDGGRVPAPATPAAPAATRQAVPKGAGDVVRFLDDRYGADGWSWEVADRRREGDEVTVMVKLTLVESGASKSQFGSGRVSGGGARTGSVDGVSFSAGKVHGGDEATAYDYATAKALRKCSDLL